MNIKYNVNDVCIIINALTEIENSQSDSLEDKTILENVKTLSNYPPKVIETILRTMTYLGSRHDDNYLKENYVGVIGLLTLKINILCDE